MPDHPQFFAAQTASTSYSNNSRGFVNPNEPLERASRTHFRGGRDANEFYFQRRKDRLDWRMLASIQIDRIIQEVRCRLYIREF